MGFRSFLMYLMHGFEKPETTDYVVVIRYKDAGVQPMVIRATSFESATVVASQQLNMAKMQKDGYTIESAAVCKVELVVTYEG